ncbi:MAG: hypothetical protein WC788_08860 [Candidatus Paceibacterota bacterium]|jgi:hypothetical protein
MDFDRPQTSDKKTENKSDRPSMRSEYIEEMNLFLKEKEQEDPGNMKASQIKEILDKIDLYFTSVKYAENNEETAPLTKGLSQLKERIEAVSKEKEDDIKKSIAEFQSLAGKNRPDDKAIKALLKKGGAEGEIEQCKLYDIQEKSATIFFGIKGENISYTAEVDFEKQTVKIFSMTGSVDKKELSRREQEERDRKRIEEIRDRVRKVDVR